jgi:hypothetical protein
METNSRVKIMADPFKLRVFATNRDHAQLCIDAVDSLSSKIRKRITLKHGQSWNTTPWGRPQSSGRSVVVSRLIDFGFDDPTPPIGRHSQYLMFTEGLPPGAIAARVPRLHVGNIHRLHLAKPEKQGTAPLVRRLISGIVIPNTHPILDAWWEGDGGSYLAVISPDLFRLRIPADKLRPFLKGGELTEFEIDDEGDFLYWPKSDVHFGWDELESLIDPVKAASAKTRNAEFSVKYGNAIRLFREYGHLSQSDIHGIDPRHLRRIEHGELPISPKAIELLAKAHGLDANNYLAAVAKHIGH